LSCASISHVEGVFESMQCPSGPLHNLISRCLLARILFKHQQSITEHVDSFETTGIGAGMSRTADERLRQQH
jgi:hypothetical protein